MLAFLRGGAEVARGEDALPAPGPADGERKLLPHALRELGSRWELSPAERECERRPRPPIARPAVASPVNVAESRVGRGTGRTRAPGRTRAAPPRDARRPPRAGLTAATEERYLRARKGDVRQAARMLAETLRWRREVRPGEIDGREFDGWRRTEGLYVGGLDGSGRPVLVTRKKADGLRPGEEPRYLRHLAWTLENCARLMRPGQERWVWLMDLNGYSRANSPPLRVSLATLRTLADHYPERLERVYLVDAPGVFSVLWNVLWPFIDPVTRAKIKFVRSADYVAAVGAGDAAAVRALDAKTGGFSEHFDEWRRPYDEAAYRALLATAGGRGGERGKRGGWPWGSRAGGLNA